MASEKHDILHAFEYINRNEVKEQAAKLFADAAAIVVIAFIIAICCVGGF